MDPKKPNDNSENLAWLGAALTRSQDDGVTTLARMYAMFYRQLTADGVPDEYAAQLTESLMIWQLDQTAGRSQG